MYHDCVCEKPLKPCPFCAEEAALNKHYPDEHGHYVIWCGNCGAYGPNDISYDKAVEMWNLRRPYEFARA